MSLNIRKIIYLGSGLLVILLVLLVVVWWQSPVGVELNLTFCDVGQGDAALIQAPGGEDILIDGGPDLLVLDCLGRHLPFYDRKIEVIILTHPHADHLMGLIPVIERYEIGQVLLTDVVDNDPIYQEFLELIKEKSIKKIEVSAGQNFVFSPDLRLEILFPLASLAGKEVKDLNDASIVSRLVYKNNKFLFMGDLGEVKEEILIKSGADLLSDVLKVGHHGSSTASSLEFLKIIKPKEAIISVGRDNKFGHPSTRIIKRLERLGIRIWRTDVNGEINVVSDGQRLEIEKNN